MARFSHSVSVSFQWDVELPEAGFDDRGYTGRAYIGSMGQPLDLVDAYVEETC